MAMINNNTAFGGVNNGNHMPAFGASAPGAPAQQHSRPPADFWLNVGVNYPGAGEKGEDVFVKLNSGIAVDDIKQVKVSGTEYWQQYTSTQNDLLAMVMEACKSLQPGESAMLNLSVQIRRKAAEVAPVDRAQNRFGLGGSLVIAPPAAPAP